MKLGTVKTLGLTIALLFSTILSMGAIPTEARTSHTIDNTATNAYICTSVPGSELRAVYRDGEWHSVIVFWRPSSHVSKANSFSITPNDVTFLGVRFTVSMWPGPEGDGRVLAGARPYPLYRANQYRFSYCYSQ